MCVKARRREYLNFKSRLESVYAARGVRRCGCECVSLKVNQRRRGGEREKRERERGRQIKRWHEGEKYCG